MQEYEESMGPLRKSSQKISLTKEDYLLSITTLVEVKSKQWPSNQQRFFFYSMPLHPKSNAVSKAREIFFFYGEWDTLDILRDRNSSHRESKIWRPYTSRSKAKILVEKEVRDVCEWKWVLCRVSIGEFICTLGI